MRILVAGGTGFIGARLTEELRRRDHDAVPMSRHPGDGQVFGDIADAGSLRAALDGVDVAYYLVHSLDRADFATYDADGARRFAAAAAGAGVRRIVYLGGLGEDDDDLSAHLRSRREVECILATGMPTVALRAGIVVGPGSAAWEVLCELVERLPVMVTPRWVQTRTQPIALDDIIALLASSVDEQLVPPGHYDVGAPDSVTYLEMMSTISAVLRRHRLIVPVPVLSPQLSSWWLRLVTSIDFRTARNLVDSMTNTVVVHERRLEQLTGVTPRSFELAARQALAHRLDPRRERAQRANQRHGAFRSLVHPDLRRASPCDGAPMSGLLHDTGRTARRWTVAGVLALGAVVLSITLRLPRGSPEFVVASFVLAATWSTPTVLFGPSRGVARWPRYGGRRDWRLDVTIGTVVGSAMYGLFVVGLLVARQVSWLDGPTRHILDKADAGPTAVIIVVALVNGVAEELFFRGSLIDALDENRPAAYLTSFLVYVGVTALVGNTALTLAAVAMGAVLTLERRLTGALAAAITTHVVWSFLVIVALPRP